MALLLALLLLLVMGYALLALFYFVFQERFIFIRFRVGPNYRFQFGYQFEERTMTTLDGALLHGLYFPADRESLDQGTPRGLIIYFHGNTGSLRRWGKYAPRLTRHGYDVLMPDPRGYGKSRGRLSEEALHRDAELWYDHAREQWKEERIVLYGRSLGSGLAVPLAARRSPRMLLLETPFANLVQVARNYLPILPYRILLRYTFRNDRAIRGVRCPVYIFHGKRDTVVPYTSALRLYSNVPSTVPREMFTFPKGHHSDLTRFKRFDRTLARLLNSDTKEVPR